MGVIVFTLRAPAIVTVLPLSLILESPIVLLPVNIASLPLVPPELVTPPPAPTQLPAVVQISYVPAAAVPKL